MYGQFFITQGVLLACVLVGWFVGHKVHKFADKRFTAGDLEGSELSRLGATLGFVGGAVGILLGLLLSFSVAQFDETRSDVQQISQSGFDFFTASEAFDEAERTELRRDTVCTLRSIVDQDWPAIGNNVTGGSTATTDWLMKLNGEVSRLDLDTPEQIEASQILTDSSTQLTSAREALVMESSIQIPHVVWIVIFFASFVMALILAMHLADRRVMAVISATLAWGMLAVILGALTVLDSPLTPVFGTASIEATPIEHTLVILQETYPDPALWADCPTAK